MIEDDAFALPDPILPPALAYSMGRAAPDRASWRRQGVPTGEGILMPMPGWCDCFALHEAKPTVWVKPSKRVTPVIDVFERERNRR